MSRLLMVGAGPSGAVDLDPPLPPAGVFLSDEQPTSTQINWTIGNEPDIQDHRVYKSLIGPSSGFSLLDTIVTPTAFYVDTTYNPLIQQWYVVAARDNASPPNESVFSAAVFNTPGAPLPIADPAQDAETPEQIALYAEVTAPLNEGTTASVEYRVNGQSTWIPAAPMWRIEPNFTDTVESPTPVLDAFAGVIFDLAPGITYDVRITFNDGVTQDVRSDQFVTRALPVTAPAQTDTATTQGELETAIGSAVAGTVIELTSSFALSSTVSLSGLTGTAAQPIFIRGTDRDSIVITRGDNGAGFNIDNCEHIVFENFTFTGLNADGGGSSSMINCNDSGGVPDAITVRQMKVLGVDHFIFSNNGSDASNFTVYDNIVEGNNQYIPGGWGIDTTEVQTWDDDGIKLAGFGHCYFNNTMSWFGDTFGVQHSPSIGLGSDSRGIFIYRNDIWYSGDDAIELDYSHRNNAFYDNRVTNCATGISIDGIYGGPIYAFRNRIINTRRFMVKNGDQATGVLLWNNTFVATEGEPHPSGPSQEFGWYWPSSAFVEDWQFVNNLIIWEGSSFIFVAEAGSQVPAVVTNNGWGRNGTNIIWNPSSGPSASGAVIDVQGLSPLFDNDIEITNQAAVFTDPVSFGADWSTAITVEHDLTLKSGAEGIGGGVLIPNIND